MNNKIKFKIIAFSYLFYILAVDSRDVFIDSLIINILMKLSLL